MKKILVPIDLPNTSLGAVHQAAYLARQFHSEVVLLHVVSPVNYPAGLLESGHEMTAKDLHAEVVRRSQKALQGLALPEFDGISVKRLVLRGEPAREITQTASSEGVDLIVLSTHGFGAFYRFLLGSVAAKVLHDSDCAVWTTAYTEELPAREFAVRNVACAVDLSGHSGTTLTRASQFAATLGARLTIIHVTPSVETYGPGGNYVNPEWRDAIVGGATKEIAKLQQQAGTAADVIIESGDAHTLLNKAAEQADADVLVIGHLPPGGHLGQNGSGYSIIRGSHIPVLSV